MSYKQIDEQFDEKFGKVKIMSDNQNEGIPGAYIHIEGKDYYVVEGNDDIKSFLHQIYSQAKAEQREIDAGIVDSFGFANKTLEEKYNELIGNVEIDREGDSYKNGFNQASKVIATAIRQEGK